MIHLGTSGWQYRGLARPPLPDGAATLKADAAALDATLAFFPGNVRVAVEPRHPTWWTKEVRGVLERRGAALCWADRCGRPITPLWHTAGWGHLRLHEGRAKPWPRYGRQALDAWAGRLDPAVDTYVYVNNDPGGAAVTDAAVFARPARRRGLGVTASPG